MIIINTDKKTFISGNYGKTNFSIPYTLDKYEKLKDLELKGNSAKTVQEFKEVLKQVEAVIKTNFKEDIAKEIKGIVYNPETSNYHIDLSDNYISDIYIPQKLVDIIFDNYSRGIDNSPIVNMCRRFLLNPKPTQDRLNMLANYVTQKWVDENAAKTMAEEQGIDIEVALKYCTYSDIQITTEGYLKTYKVVDLLKDLSPEECTSKLQRDSKGRFIKATQEQQLYLESMQFEPAIYKNGDKFYSGSELGYKYEIGKLAALPGWEYTSLVDESYHDKGLHNGGISYVQGYLYGNRHLLEVFVCPSQIAKFTDQGLGEMTCKEFFIYGITTIDGNMRSLYHTSSYAKIQSEEISIQITDALESEDELKYVQKVVDLALEDNSKELRSLMSFSKTINI